MIGLGVVIAAAAVIAIIYFSQVQGILAAYAPTDEIRVRFNTAPTLKRDDQTCLTSEGGVAKEVLDLSSGIIFVAGGENPISDVDWQAANIGFPYQKNTTRYLLFTDSCFFASPDAPASCVGDACFTRREYLGHTWLNLSELMMVRCAPEPLVGCSNDGVQPKHLSINVTSKCHQITFTGEIYDLSDGKGNRYVMHATADGNPTTEVELPDGWTLQKRTLSDPFVISPNGDNNGCYYNIVRDHKLQSYHQYAFASAQFPE